MFHHFGPFSNTNCSVAPPQIFWSPSALTFAAEILVSISLFLVSLSILPEPEGEIYILGVSYNRTGPHRFQMLFQQSFSSDKLAAPLKASRLQVAVVHYGESINEEFGYGIMSAIGLSLHYGGIGEEQKKTRT